MSNECKAINNSGDDSLNDSNKSVPDYVQNNDNGPTMVGEICHSFFGEKKKKICVKGYSFCMENIGLKSCWVCEAVSCSALCEVEEMQDILVIKTWNPHRNEPSPNLGQSCVQIKTNRGKVKLHSQGISYHLERNADWSCSQRKSGKCRGRISVLERNGDFVISKFNEHNHTEDATEHPLAEFNNSLKNLAKTSGQPSCKIIKDLKIAANQNVVPFLGLDRV